MAAAFCKWMAAAFCKWMAAATAACISGVVSRADSPCTTLGRPPVSPGFGGLSAAGRSRPRRARQ
jgi:hypothetical protein